MKAKALSLFSRAVRRTAIILITSTAIVAAGALVWVGTSTLSARANQVVEVDAAPPLPVRTALLEVENSYEVQSTFSGRVEARQVTPLGFERGGTVAVLNLDEGDRIKKGDIVAELDTRLLEADLAAQMAARDALTAQRDLAKLTADRQKVLVEGDHVSQQRYDEARLAVAQLEAELRASEAGITAIEIALDKARIRSPFDAIAGTRHADAGTRIAGGTPVIDLYEDAAPAFRVGLPGAEADRLSPGDTAEILVDGRRTKATVERIRDDVDPVTRTRDVVFALPKGAALTDGALGELTLSRTVSGTGAWVDAAALGEGVRGLWTVYLIANDGETSVARRESVELIYMQGDRAFVRGTFAPGTQVITEGPHRVADGQSVILAPEG